MIPAGSVQVIAGTHASPLTISILGQSISGIFAFEQITTGRGQDGIPGTPDDVSSGADLVLMTADDVYKLPLQGVKVYIDGFANQAVYTGADIAAQSA